MSTGRRLDGYAPIGDYGVLGDGRTVALVASDGRVDWWPMPTLDAPPVCAAILDPEGGGHFSLAPALEFDVTRQYLPGTNVLASTYTTATGKLRVTDSLNVGSAGRLPWTELARRVEGLAGSVELCWEFSAGDRFGRARPFTTTHDGVPVITVGDQTLAVIVDKLGPVKVSAHKVMGSGSIRAGERRLVGVVGTDREPVPLPSPSAINARIDVTIDSWRRWSALIDHHGPWADAVVRSALALKTILFEPGGAIAAAATTSLPEAIGGSKNWDYRYAWVRDSSFTLDAFINLALDEEVHAAVSWLLSAVKATAPDLHVFYSLSGNVSSDEETLDVPGYQFSRPVRAGNGAARQTQLGTFGDLLDTVWRYVSAGHVLDHDTGRLMVDLADRCCDMWMRKDSGIWELPQLEHYTISKMGCWVALNRATRLASVGQIPPEHSERWRHEACDIKRWVESNCWSDEKQSYTFYAGTDDLDASVLLAARTGFDRGPRLASTVAAVTRELGHGALLYRYAGMDQEEGAFVACTFWLVDALVHLGRIDEAAELMDEAVQLTNELGLFSEQLDPTTRDFLGNIPQGLSHLALINAAHAFDEARSTFRAEAE